MHNIKKNFTIKKIIITSLFIALACLSHELSKYLFIYPLKMPWGRSLFQISVFILLLSGHLLGWKNSFIICFFYTIYHVMKSFSHYLINNETLFNFEFNQKFGIILLDYIIPDLSISLYGLFYRADLKHLENKKRIAYNFFFVLFFRNFFYFCSSYFIFVDTIIHKSSVLTTEANILVRFLLKILQHSPLLFCFLYNYIPFVITYFLNLIFMIYFSTYIKQIQKEYLN
ncbi:MAG: hypothetical protein Q8784_01345 [Vigna little leaf phytoplasma]|nr:hypothetical protein [Vigna little leaf phytoplasma]